jgi:cysteine desulfurase / selenocysteine lyase
VPLHGFTWDTRRTYGDPAGRGRGAWRARTPESPLSCHPRLSVHLSPGRALMADAAPLSDEEVRRIRDAEFSALGDAAYLDAASVAPLPNRSRRAIESFSLSRSAPHTMTGEQFEGSLARCRSALARVVGAEEGEIALGANTSFGINLAALGLPIRAGRCILTSDGEFPANVYPWMALRERGVRFEMIPLTAAGHPDEERIIARMDQGDVALLAISSVQFATGFRADLKRLGDECRNRGIFFVVDAIQSVGNLALDLRALHVDVLAAGGHKWLCGPFGSGFAYVRREVQDILDPRWIGWNAMRAGQDLARLTDYAWGFLPDARRYEAGTPAFHDMLALAHSAELLLEIGIDRIERHLVRITGLIGEWVAGRLGYVSVSDREPARRSAIIAIRTPSVRHSHSALRSAGVQCAHREGALRFSPHLYTTESEIRRVLEILESEGSHA